MNEYGKRLKAEAEKQEALYASRVAADPYRLRLHLMPKVGWMNDPNGLCQFQGLYHVFFQYSPMDARGGMKAWGHYVSQDFIHWKREESPFFWDMPFDKDGVYSGSAYIEENQMFLYYTGNVKQEGNHDYVLSGREANTVLVTSKDGLHFSEKQLLMTNKDYPSDYTCHIRDPKVFREKDTFYMVQGGRKKGDKGAVLLFDSKDLLHWSFQKEVTTEENFGYMWECPDYFLLGGQPILSCSPQGLAAETYRYQNIYQSGYFLMKEKLVSGELEEDSEKNLSGKRRKNVKVFPEKFFEWDMGFDFYAPQTFEDETGRRILIGWCGIPDAEYDNEPTIAQGWQHALTFPRVLTFQDGKVFQNPVEELKKLRTKSMQIPTGENRKAPQEIFELEIDKEPETECSVEISCGKEFVKLDFSNQVCRLSVSEGAGRGRKERKMQITSLSDIRIFADTSMLEIYINRGEAVFTTRFYFPNEERYITIEGTDKNVFYCLGEMEGL